MKLVKFKNGKFGVRRWSLFGWYEFVSFDMGCKFWWGSTSDHFEDCQTTEEQAREFYNRIGDNGKVVK